MQYVIGFILFFAVLIGAPIYIGIWGLHWNSGTGSQTGFVSATEREGFFFKTNRAYIKPTLESTQEDVYCVIDPEVYTALQAAEVEKRPVRVKHFSFVEPGALYCKGEAAIISAVE